MRRQQAVRTAGGGVFVATLAVLICAQRSNALSQGLSKQIPLQAGELNGLQAPTMGTAEVPSFVATKQGNPAEEVLEQDASNTQVDSLVEDTLSRDEKEALETLVQNAESKWLSDDQLQEAVGTAFEKFVDDEKIKLQQVEHGDNSSSEAFFQTAIMMPRLRKASPSTDTISAAEAVGDDEVGDSRNQLLREKLERLWRYTKHVANSIWNDLEKTARKAAKKTLSKFKEWDRKARERLDDSGKAARGVPEEMAGDEDLPASPEDSPNPITRKSPMSFPPLEKLLAPEDPEVQLLPWNDRIRAYIDRTKREKNERELKRRFFGDGMFVKGSEATSSAMQLAVGTSAEKGTVLQDSDSVEDPAVESESDVHEAVGDGPANLRLRPTGAAESYVGELAAGPASFANCADGCASEASVRVHMAKVEDIYQASPAHEQMKVENIEGEASAVSANETQATTEISANCTHGCKSTRLPSEQGSKDASQEAVSVSTVEQSAKERNASCADCASAASPSQDVAGSANQEKTVPQERLMDAPQAAAVSAAEQRANSGCADGCGSSASNPKNSVGSKSA